MKIILIILIFSIKIVAQTPITLDQAIEKSWENNLNIKTGKLSAEFQNKLRNSYAVVDPLVVSGGFGQSNSAYMDNSINLTQILRFPGFYKNQKKLLDEEWKNALLSTDQQKWLLKKQIALVYNELNYFNEKKVLLKKSDSLISRYYKTAENRLKHGESNILEKTTAENMRSQIWIQIENLKNDREIALRQFNFLINNGQNYTNIVGNFYQQSIEIKHNFEGNPIEIKRLEQQKKIEKVRLAAEKAKLLPSLHFGATSATQYGFGSDEKFYERSKRFYSGVVGIGLPIFNKGQKAVIEANKVSQLIAENNFDLGKKTMINQYTRLFNEYQKLKSETDYYKKQGLANSKTILETADRLFFKGEINYMEFSLLVTQALDLENKLINSQKLLNDKIIEIRSMEEGL